MKKKFLTFGLTAAMVLGSVFSTFAVEQSKSGGISGDLTVTGFFNEKTDAVPLEDGNEYTFTFHEKSNGTNWYENYVMAVTGAIGDEYKGADQEILIVRADNCGWGGKMSDFTDSNTGAEGTNKLVFETNVNWESWASAVQSTGLDCTVKVSRDGNTLSYNGQMGEYYFRTTATSGIELPKTCYVFFTGEKCEITNIKTMYKESPNAESVELGTGSGDNTGDKPGDNTGDKPGDNTGDKPGDNTGDKPGDNTGDKPGDNTGDKPGDNTGDKPGDNTGDKTESPNTNNVEATTITEAVAKAVAEAAKVVSADGKALDVKLVVAPVEKAAEAAVTAMVKADEALSKAGVKSIAVLDLKLMAGDKNITLLDNKISVTIPMDKIFEKIAEKNVVAVYRVDKVNDKDVLSFLGTTQVAADKTIKFATEHFSQYVFAVVDNEEALSKVKIVNYKDDIDKNAVPDKKVDELVKKDASVDDPKKPATGDTTPVMPLVILAVVALGGVVAVVASKKRA